MSLPAAIATHTDALAPELVAYWQQRAVQHTNDSYAGIPISKFPEDLRVYEHLLWEMRADFVVEIGCQFGGSTLWFRDRLEAFARYRPELRQRLRVVAVDIDVAAAREGIAAVDPAWQEQITLVEGDVNDPAVAEHVRSLVPSGARPFVIEDSAHVYETTLAALRHYAGLVPEGGYFVVEDGCIDIEELRIAYDWPRGVLPAIDDWLASPAGRDFRVRRDLELYGITCHPKGFLERVAG